MCGHMPGAHHEQGCHGQAVAVHGEKGSVQPRDTSEIDIRGDAQSAGVEARRVLDPRQAAASFSTRTLQYDERPCGD